MIKIFNDERFATSSEETHLQMFGALCVTLAEAADADDKEQAWRMMREASEIGHPLGSHMFNVLYGATAMEITRKFDFDSGESRRKSVLDKIKEVFA